MNEVPIKFPMFMLGFLVGVAVGFVLASALGHAQSWSPGADGGVQYRSGNVYDSGGVMYTPGGPVYDYGVPKVGPPTVPAYAYWGILGARHRESSSVEASVREATAAAWAGARATCRQLVEMNKFLGVLGVEPPPTKGVCDGVE